MKPDSEGSPPQRRDNARRTVIKGARIVFNNRKNTMNCRVRDLSTGGARLEIPTEQLLPHTFELHIGSEPIRHCELRWVKGSQAGVRFLSDKS